MAKTRILLASVLKPVTDSRMFEKLGKSLAKLPDTETHLFGQEAKITQHPANIYFHTLFSFHRASLNRLGAQWNFYKTVRKVKPQVIIITTPELLPLTALFKILFKAEIYYDVQENYFKNITLQPTYPKWFRPLLAFPLRGLEKLSTLFISHYFLAEKSYAAELTFLKQNATVLENKFIPDPEFQPTLTFPVQLKDKPLAFLYSGTITTVYGIWEAIELVTQLHKLDQSVTLTIIGYCPQKATYLELKKALSDKPFISLKGGDKLVPHPEIVEEIRKAAIGILPYQPNPSTANCIPTKLYEYLANGLPVLIPDNPLWQEIVAKSKSGFSIDFQNPATQTIYNRLRTDTFYPNGIPGDVFWQQEEQKLLSVFAKKV